MRVLVFGDSIAMGFWDTEGGWVARLRRYYDKKQIADLESARQPTIYNLAVDGDVSSGVLNRIKAESNARRSRWDTERYCVVVAIGINDSVLIDGRVRVSPDEFGRNVDSIADLAKEFTNRLIIIGLTPVEEKIANSRPRIDTKYFNESRIVVFNEELEKVSKKHGITYVPLFDAIRGRLAAGEQLLIDGLHPNNEGHELIFQIVRPELDKLVK